MKRLVILASGSGTLAQAIFDAGLDADIVAVISDQPDAAVLDRAHKAAERRLQFNRQKSSQLREGTYFEVPSNQLPEGFELE